MVHFGVTEMGEQGLAKLQIPESFPSENLTVWSVVQDPVLARC